MSTLQELQARRRTDRRPRDADRAPAHAPPASPTALTALQRSAGNRAMGRVLARYSAPTKAYAFGVADLNARTPFTLAEEHVTVQPRTTPGAPGHGMGFAAKTPNKPPLLIADDGTMAINSKAGEPREFYAAQDVITTSNAKLAQVGSPVRLHKGGNRITPNGSVETLEMVTPMKAGATPPAPTDFVTLTTTICADVAAHVVGGSISYAKVGGEKVRGTSTAHSTVVPGTHELAQSMVAGESATKARGAMEAGAGRAAKDVPKVGAQYGTALGAGTLDAKAQELGVNQFARPEVGEAYVTQRIENMGESLRKDYSQGGTQHAFTWGYHFAAVVAQSRGGQDQITLENYNRAGDLQEGRKVLLQRLEADFAAQLTGYLAANPMPALTATSTDEEERSKQENVDDKMRLQRIGEILHWLEHTTKATVDEAKAAYQAMHDERLARNARLWYFRMVGRQNAQSFHEQMASSTYFSNPLTLAVGARGSSGKPVVAMFDEGKAALKAPAPAELDVLAQMFLIDQPKGKASKVVVKGYASGGGAGGDKRRARKARETADLRAAALRAALEARHVPANLIVVKYGAREPTWSDKESRRAVAAVE